MAMIPKKLGNSDVRSGLRYEHLYGAFSANPKNPLCRITQAKSAISLNPMAGCYFNCIYCYRHDVLSDTKAVKPKRVFSDKEIIKALIKHPFFEKNKTIIAPHCASTEPFLPEVLPSTLAMIKLIINNHGLLNPIWIITKSCLSSEIIKQLLPYKKQLIISVTYSSMPKKIEPMSRDRAKTIKLLKQASIKTILHYRPLVSGWNLSVRQITKTLSSAKDVDAILIGGLRISKGIEENMKKHNIPIPKSVQRLSEKKLDQENLKKILYFCEKLKIKSPVFITSSCALSYLLNKPDYNANWQKSKYCHICPLAQRKLCQKQAKKPLDKTIIQKTIKKLGICQPYRIINNQLIFLKSLVYQEYWALRSHLRIPISIVQKKHTWEA